MFNIFHLSYTLLLPCLDGDNNTDKSKPEFDVSD